jgi:hypothetical protein
VPGFREVQLDGLADWMRTTRLHCYVLHSSVGMHGFVVARSMRIVPRERRHVRASRVS